MAGKGITGCFIPPHNSNSGFSIGGAEGARGVTGSRVPVAVCALSGEGG